MKNLTFSGDSTLKQSLLENLKQHQDLDAFVQGSWIKKDEIIDGGHFKGCFYGCTMQTTDDPILAFSQKYNIDLWYCHLTEKIFEGLPDGEYQKFPYESIDILPVSFDFNALKSSFNKSILLKQLDWIKDDNVRKILVQTSELFDVPFDKIDIQAARSAESAAWSAARSAAWSAEWSAAESAARSAAESAEWSAAESAARSAARSAESAARSAEWSAAESAARSAESAALSAARSAARSAESAARSAEWSAAESNHYVWMRDALFELIKNQ